MRIAFYLANTWAWTPEDLRNHGVGGTETALGNLSRAFARLGHDVTVFHAASTDGLHGGVRFRHFGTLDHGDRWDAFVSLCRVPGIRSIHADVKVHWCMEHVVPGLGAWTEMLPALDAVFAISPYHRSLLRRRLNLPQHRLYTSCCPIDPDEYRQTMVKVPGQLIFCSVPNRGLHHLPAIYRLARRHIPELTLIVTGDFTLWGQPPAATAAHAALAGMPGVQLLGRVPRPALVDLQKRSMLHLYPCTFKELFCLASLECQAAGAPTICSDLGALPTTVMDGRTGRVVPVGGGPRSDFERLFVDEFAPGAVEAFAAAVVELLRNPAELQAMARQARARALSRFGADVMARQWLETFASVAGRRSEG